LLRALWTDATVEFSGAQHTLHDAGLRPMPQQRPIPLWIGANAEPAVRRAGRLADGLFVNFAAGPRAERSLATVRDALADAGRDPTTFGINGSIALEGSDPAAWRHEYAWWRTRGATQVTLSPPDGLTGVDAILERLRAGFEALRYTPDE
ncbi:MAG: LLM class F420-dependent oxidoreductase, partial [Chloroflexi bacterium]